MNDAETALLDAQMDEAAQLDWEYEEVINAFLHTPPWFDSTLWVQRPHVQPKFFLGGKEVRWVEGVLQYVCPVREETTEARPRYHLHCLKRKVLLLVRGVLPTRHLRDK